MSLSASRREQMCCNSKYLFIRIGYSMFSIHTFYIQYAILVEMYDADKPILIGLILLISTLLGLLATGVLGGSVLPYQPTGIYLKKIEINGVPVRVEIADTPEARVNGLSGRTRLPESQGMLFVFDEPGRYPIWMRNMNFSIDVFWLDGRGRVVDIWENAHPESYPQVFEPRDDAYYILEVVAGFAELYNVEIGDRVNGL